MATFDSTQPGLVHDHLNQPRPRRLRCVRCGDTMVLPPDAPEVIDDPPMGWIVAALGSDGTRLYFCAVCVEETRAANDSTF